MWMARQWRSMFDMGVRRFCTICARLAILALYQWVDKGYSLQVAYYFHDYDTLVGRER